ncbi:MAG: tRNA (adenosine(37)-N6)-dimethylallyltransferase MiaA [Proteobacteria bacterium]|nr:tRNA (adenosine(37)-N6)-dimethylallyltransferase MiaA [Pseudomonadota bacterium]
MTSQRDPLAAIVISGPTASGKSSLAVSLAEYLPVEIISADSAQVYRGMDIGTAKPDADLQARITHHLIDVRDPWEPFSAADFRTAALDLVPDICARGKVPLIVGGTMLYLKALKYGLARLPEADPALRSAILAEAASRGWDQLHEELGRVDPASAARIRPTDSQRLQRAIEVYRLTGQPLSALQAASGDPCPFHLLEIAVIPPDRRQLHAEIARRFDDMLSRGFLEEVKRLHDNPQLNMELPSIRAVGYRQAWSFIDGDYDHDTMRQRAIAATRQLAKRQLTWLRSWRDLNVLEMPDPIEALKILKGDTIFTH